MNNFGCSCKGGCTFTAVAVSLLLGIVASVLRYMAIITFTPAFLWVIFGIAVLYLAILIAATAIVRCGENTCLCSVISALLAGILGTIAAAIILLAVEFAAASGIGTLIAGLCIFFFSLLITESACLVKCLANCDDITV